MANLDTQSKRMSGVNVSLPFARPLSAPDGTVDQGDRQHVAFMYSGIAAGTAVAVTITAPFEGFRQNIGRMMR